MCRIDTRTDRTRGATVAPPAPASRVDPATPATLAPGCVLLRAERPNVSFADPFQSRSHALSLNPSQIIALGQHIIRSLSAQGSVWKYRFGPKVRCLAEGRCAAARPGRMAGGTGQGQHRSLTLFIEAKEAMGANAARRRVQAGSRFLPETERVPASAPVAEPQPASSGLLLRHRDFRIRSGGSATIQYVVSHTSDCLVHVASASKCDGQLNARALLGSSAARSCDWLSQFRLAFPSHNANGGFPLRQHWHANNGPDNLVLAAACRNRWLDIPLHSLDLNRIAKHRFADR